MHCYLGGGPGLQNWEILFDYLLKRCDLNRVSMN